ncbi:MAG: Rieske 2Fe-2S domain-containing protein [Streptosporangiales bacterium]|nr:Rieske 2Fe-2S domain-containing protein [Streptosporangiales bacterium]
MTDNDNTNGSAGVPGEEPADGAETRRPRVIGTPPPAESHRLLSTDTPETDGDPYAAGPYPGMAHERSEERIRSGVRWAALFFVIAFLGSVAFVAGYVIFQVGDLWQTKWSNMALGGSLTVILLAIASGMTMWVRRVMPHYDVVDERHPLPSEQPEKQDFGKFFMAGAKESGFTRYPLLRRTLMLAMAPLGLLPLVLLRDLGPLPEKKLRHTDWKKGTKLVVDGTGEPLRAADFSSPGGIITVVPEGKEHDLDSIAKSTVLLIKLRPEELELTEEQMNWTYDGIIAYSKICTHVGCPAALYEQSTHRILCPCHQSTFDARKAAKVTFGPAARPLPMLPITVDAEGYLVAQSDFHEPVGPSFWERG